MKNIRISKTYAQVFFNKAVANKALDNVLEDFCLLRDIFDADKKLARFCTSPLSSCEQKKKVTDLCKFHSTTRELLHLLITNNRMACLSDIYEAIVKLKVENEGMVRATLFSANEMSEKDIEICIKSLEKKLNKKFSVEHKVDKSLIGGVILKFGSMMYDLSVRSAMQQLKTLRV